MLKKLKYSTIISKKNHKKHPSLKHKINEKKMN